MLYFFCHSVPDSTKRRGVCYRPCLQSCIRLYSQSHMWGKGGEPHLNIQHLFVLILPLTINSALFLLSIRFRMSKSVQKRLHGFLTCALRLWLCILATRIWALPSAPSYAPSATHRLVWSVLRPNVSPRPVLCSFSTIRVCIQAWICKTAEQTNK